MSAALFEACRRDARVAVITAAMCEGNKLQKIREAQGSLGARAEGEIAACLMMEAEAGGHLAKAALVYDFVALEDQLKEASRASSGY